MTLYCKDYSATVFHTIRFFFFSFFFSFMPVMQNNSCHNGLAGKKKKTQQSTDLIFASDMWQFQFIRSRI